MKNELHIYVRVSTQQQQVGGFGLKNQIDKGKQIAKSLGLTPVIRNEGGKSSHSDSIESRPILTQLLTDVEDGKVKNLYVYNNDRLSRNENVWTLIRKRLKENDVTLYVGDGSKYEISSDLDNFVFGILSEVTKYDNSIRTERLRRGKLSKIKKGFWIGGPAPYGFEIVDSQLVPNKSEIAWVKKMYEMYRDGHSLYTISAFLSKNGVLTRRGNVIWSENTILNVLSNTHFEGFYYYKDKKLDETVRCECPKTLPLSLVKQVRERLSKRKRTSNYQKVNTLLKEFLVCGHCGSGFGQRINKSQYFNHYYCRGNTERRRTMGHDAEKICKTKGDYRVRSLNIDDTDDLVWQTVVNVVESSTLFKESFKEQVLSKESFGKSVVDRSKLRRQIKRIESELKKIRDGRSAVMVDGLLDGDDEDVKSLLAKFDEKRLELETQRERIVEEINHNEKSSIWVEWIGEFGAKIDSLKDETLTTEEKKKFLSGIIKEIRVTTASPQTHHLELIFDTPMVGDDLQWNMKGKSKKKYQIIEGATSTLVELDSSDKRVKKKQRIKE